MPVRRVRAKKGQRRGGCEEGNERKGEMKICFVQGRTRKRLKKKRKELGKEGLKK